MWDTFYIKSCLTYENSHKKMLILYLSRATAVNVMMLAMTLTLVAKDTNLQRISPCVHSPLKLYSKPRGILNPEIKMSLMARLIRNMLVTFRRDLLPRMTKMTRVFPESAKSIIMEYTTVKIILICPGTGGGIK